MPSIAAPLHWFGAEERESAAGVANTEINGGHLRRLKVAGCTKPLFILARGSQHLCSSCKSLLVSAKPAGKHDWKDGREDQH